MAPSRYHRFTRDEWARLRADTALSLTEHDLARLRGLNDRVSLDEVTEIYLPLSRLINLHIGASQALHGATATFLNTPAARAPYLIGLAGSVAVGKSTTARIMQALLGRWPDHPKVDLVATDGFLYPRHVLEERGILQRKGFPERSTRGADRRRPQHSPGGRPVISAAATSAAGTSSASSRCARLRSRIRRRTSTVTPS
jgi:type I pantothenate kinase